MDIKTVLLIINLFFLLFSILLNIIYIIKPNIKNNKKENNVSVDRLKLLLDQDKSIVERVDLLIDEIIKKAADTYMILNVNFNKEKYINSKESEEMINYISFMVKLNMTPEIRELIGLVRVINSEKDLDDYLNLKIKIYVLAVIVNVNKPL